MKQISLPELCPDIEQTFIEWREEQEFEYRRAESEAIDYVNQLIDYQPIDNSSEQVRITDWEQFFDECRIEVESQYSVAVRRHITAYAEERSGT
jgi:hypothetical protein